MPIESVSSTASATKAYASEDVQRRGRRPEEEDLQAANKQATQREEVQLSQQARRLASQPSVDESKRDPQDQNSAEAAREPRGPAASAIAAYQKAAQG